MQLQYLGTPSQQLQESLSILEIEDEKTVSFR